MVPVLGHVLKQVPRHGLGHVPGHMLEHMPKYVPDRHLLASHVLGHVIGLFKKIKENIF